MKTYNKAEIQHIYRFAKQKISKPDVAIIGGYFGGNLGDMALGQSVKNALRKEGIKGEMQTVYNLHKWPKVKKAILGGGAIGNTKTLKIICDRYKGNYQDVAIAGVDFTENEYPNEILDLLNESCFISCRSDIQAAKLKKLTGRKDIHIQSDLVFSLETEFCQKQRENNVSNKKKLLMLNVLPLYAEIENDLIKPIELFKEQRPELHEDNSFNLMHFNYQKTLSKIIENAILDDYSIETIPFTPEDEYYGRIQFKNAKIKHNKYDPDIKKMLNMMSNSTKIISTRLHATIFALKLGKPILPIAYAYKNEELLSSIGINNSNYISTLDLAKNNEKPLDFINGSKDKIFDCEKNSSDVLHNCINALHQN